MRLETSLIEYMVTRILQESMAPFVPEGFKDKYENYQAVLADGWEFTDDGFWINVLDK